MRNIGRRLIRLVDGAVNLAVLSILLLLLFYGCYGIWDSQQLYASADNARYEIYKPADEEDASFDELLKLNPDVFGWLTVYGTNIDYPLLQGTDNAKYVNTAADGTYSLSGSLFLDYRNRNDFADYNSVIYGHHMDQHVMFGELSDFKEREYFDEHQYGTIYYAGKLHGIEFFAFLALDAYDSLYRPGVTETEEQEAYWNRIWENALNVRELEQAEELHLVLLSTCTSESTNGRHILVGRITDEAQPDPFCQELVEKHLIGIDGRDTLWERLQEFPWWLHILLIFIILILLLALTVSIARRIRENRKRKGGSV